MLAVNQKEATMSLHDEARDRGLGNLARLAAGLTATCGLRVSELAALRWEDVDVAERQIYVTSKKLAAAAATRAVGISEEMAVRLAFAAPVGWTDYVFAGRASTSSEAALRRLLRHAAAQAILLRVAHGRVSVHAARLAYVRRRIGLQGRGE